MTKACAESMPRNTRTSVKYVVEEEKGGREEERKGQTDQQTEESTDVTPSLVF